LDSFTIGDNAKSDNVVISMRNKGAKNKTRYKAGSGIRGKVLAMTMRSNGNSKIIGAARAPMAAPASLTGQSWELLMRTIMTKVAPTAVKVTGVMGSGGRA
jgi:hypothetical protein